MIGLSVKHPVFRNLIFFLAIFGFILPASAQEDLTAEEVAGLFKKGEGVTDIDGNFYPTVIIGDQEWMAENLRVTRDAEGNKISRFLYKGKEKNAALYGGLYSWGTAMNKESSSTSGHVQGICPDGWHLPSDQEWSQLTGYLIDNHASINETNVGDLLKSCRQVSSPLGGSCKTSEHPRWDANENHHGIIKEGFGALPGGYRHPLGLFAHQGILGYWWTSTNKTELGAMGRYISFKDGRVYPYHSNKNETFSIRCVKD